ncbi:MAG: DUF433 domain-containing protein [Candidatus Scalindua sp.]|nr:DUF433 domain-containing protein [Candidatus Scalindua sp.]
MSKSLQKHSSLADSSKPGPRWRCTSIAAPIISLDSRFSSFTTFDFLASGMTFDDVLNEYPHLQPEDIYACIAYGAEMSRERYEHFTIESTA